jgi:hypothetical protein
VRGKKEKNRIREWKAGKGRMEGNEEDWWNERRKKAGNNKKC